MEYGILYIATEPKYIEEAKRSARKAKSVMNVPIAVVSDRDISYPHFDEVIIDQNPQRSFADKPRNLKRTPYERTLYLDTDTFLLEDCAELFEMLDKIDIATSIDPNEYELRYLKEDPFGIPKSFPIYQTGVIAYRMNEAVETLINDWNETQTSSSVERDQITFRSAMYHSDAKIKFSSFSPIYNFLVGSPMRVIDEVKIIHDTKGDIDKMSDLEGYSRRLNSTCDQRLVYTYYDDICCPLLYRKDIAFIFISKAVKMHDVASFTIWSLLQEGPKETVSRIKQFLRKF